MATWTRKIPQVKEGDYHFNGLFLTTTGVQSALAPEEIQAIYEDVKAFVSEKDGIDYLQVFENGNGQRLFFIDSLSRRHMAENSIDPNDHECNHCTLMFDHEY